MMSISGKVFNIQRFSTEDGPGVRTTVFLKGCPLRCLWCSNPESQSPNRQAAHKASLCVSCGKCLQACSVGAVSFTDGDETKEIRVDRERCKNCGECVNACTTGAMKFFGQTITAGEVMSEVKKDAAYYISSQGGVTVSGGEPLAQADFVSEIFRRCRDIGIHTALDTSGYFETAGLNKVLDHADLILFDIKLIDPRRHILLTGVDNGIILQNARLIAQAGVQMIVRIPVIPGINDREEDLEDSARFISELSNKPQVNLLPYHNYGENKYKMLDMFYRLHDTERPSDGHMLWCKGVFEKYNLECLVC